MLTRRTLMLALPMGLMVLGGPAAIAAAPSQDEAQKLVKQLSEDAIKLLTQKDLPAEERSKRFRALLVKGFDVPEMARFTLGRYWRDLADDQRKQYLQLFEDFVVATYAQRFANYQGETLQVQGAQPESDDVLVRSQFMRVNPPQPVKVDWRVSQSDQGPRIVDVIVENVSLTTTQRSDFAAVIQRNGGKIEGLLDTLKAKTKDLNSNA